jgi:hypothetical protein
MDADRKVSLALLSSEPCGISRHHSVMYRVSDNGPGVSPGFFARGNGILGRGVGGYDFEGRRDIYLFHFNAAQTQWYVHGDADKNPLEEWCPTIWTSLHGEYNLLDGFANLHFLPQGATCLITMCHPSTLPLEVLAKRPDLRRIVYTAESPNIRHRDQWGHDFLKASFDRVLTFWEPLLRLPTTTFAPHNSRFLRFPDHDRVLRDNAGPGTGSVVIVLENRATSGPYIIDGETLHCQDALRASLATGLRDVTACGAGWDGVPGVKLGNPGLPRSRDPLTSVDYYQKHDFALIVENCDALGYVSEKFGDALIGGAIPLYRGNPGPRIALPPGAFIDITGCRSGRDVQALIDAADIPGLKSRVAESRREFLEARGCDVIADAVREAITRSAEIAT